MLRSKKLEVLCWSWEDPQDPLVSISGDVHNEEDITCAVVLQVDTDEQAPL